MCSDALVGRCAWHILAYTAATSLQAREETAGKRDANDWVITNHMTTAEHAARLI